MVIGWICLISLNTKSSEEHLNCLKSAKIFVKLLFYINPNLGNLTVMPDWQACLWLF